MENFTTDSEFERFRKIIYDHSSINFSSSNRAVLESRLKERLKICSIKTVSEYYDMVSSDQEELRTLLDTVTTNLTRFFRNKSHFETLGKYVIPDWLNNKRSPKGRCLRIWSAGCSTGEEPYTVAMVLKDNLPGDVKVEIIGSDLSLKSLITAKAGFYPQTRVEDIPQHLLLKYFEKTSDGYQITDEIKNLVRFDYHNLKFEATFRDLDIVFCRNVLIYFDHVAQKEVIQRFWKIMNDRSYLFIGHSESLFGMNTQFKFIKTDWACIYGKDGAVT